MIPCDEKGVENVAGTIGQDMTLHVVSSVHEVARCLNIHIRYDMNICKTAASGKPLVLSVPVIITVTVYCGNSTIFQNVSPTESRHRIYFDLSFVFAEM
jgi:hypothetical protein